MPQAMGSISSAGIQLAGTDRPERVVELLVVNKNRAVGAQRGPSGLLWTASSLDHPPVSPAAGSRSGPDRGLSPQPVSTWWLMAGWDADRTPR